MKINKNITTVNRWLGRFGCSVEWIVLHYTANTYQPDRAKNECAAFANSYVGASAHFFVDESEIWQSVELCDTAWHCGDLKPSLNGCTNMSSIGIEMCVNYENGVYSIPDATVENTLSLVLNLLEAYPEAKICRHYDVTGKRCPMPWVDHPEEWEKFRRRVEENRPMTPSEKREFEALKAQVVALTSKVKTCVETDLAQNRDISKIDERTKVQYESLKKCPAWAKPTVAKLVERGDLKGDENGNLGLTTDLTRTLVIVDRAGGFDK